MRTRVLVCICPCPCPACSALPLPWPLPLPKPHYRYSRHSVLSFVYVLAAIYPYHVHSIVVTYQLIVYTITTYYEKAYCFVLEVNIWYGEVFLSHRCSNFLCSNFFWILLIRSRHLYHLRSFEIWAYQRLSVELCLDLLRSTFLV